MSGVIVSAEELELMRSGAGPRQRVSVLIVCCFLIVAAIVVMGIFGHLVAPQNANAQNLALGLSKPSGGHWLGTDQLGRDIFSRVIVGARTALIGPLLIAAGSMLIGNILGLLAGYRGGMVDAVIMRWVDLMWSLPNLLVIIVVVGAVGGGYWLAVLLLMIHTIAFDARVVRGATLEQTPLPYVEAARTLGVSTPRIMLFHIWPNVSPVAVANAFLVLAGSFVALAGISYLGLGARPGTPDWGLMVSENRSLLFASPAIVLAPCVAIVLAAASMNLIGDWFYELLSSRGASK